MTKWWLALRTRLGLFTLLAVAGCFDPLVGHPCAPGYSLCGEACVDLTTSASHCGACGVTCSGTCQAAICVSGGGGTGGAGDPDAKPDAGGDTASDLAQADGPGADAGADGLTDGAGGLPPDAGADAGSDAAGTDAVNGGADSGSAIDAPSADVIVGSDTASGSDAPGAADSASVADAASAADLPPPLMCNMGFTPCVDRCVEVTTDPDNCGACGTRCGSGLCAAGVCQQEGVGHVVVIGHDYVVNRSGMNNLLGNAVFLSAGDPLKILVFEGEASAGAMAGTDAAINQVAAERGRRWGRTVGTGATIMQDLAAYDVLLIYAQHGSNNATLVSRGVTWALALNTFVMAGKTVVLLDGTSPNNNGTFQILSSAGLFLTTARADVTGQTLQLANPADALAPRVPRSYRAEMTSVSFTTLEPGKVVTAPGGAPVVIHRTF
jgi:hypothetical protein